MLGPLQLAASFAACLSGSARGRRMQVVLERVKSAERLPGVDEILLPGERGGRMAAERLARGVMPVEEALVNGLRTMAAKYDAQGSPKAAKSAMHVATQLVHPKTSIQVRAVATCSSTSSMRMSFVPGIQMAPCLQCGELMQGCWPALRAVCKAGAPWLVSYHLLLA